MDLDFPVKKQMDANALSQASVCQKGRMIMLPSIPDMDTRYL